MDDVRLQHLIGGKGNREINIPLTLDFRPILVTMRYDPIKNSYHNVFTDENIDIYHDPEFVKNIYTLDNFQQLVDIVCDQLKIEKREIYCKKEFDSDVFRFTKDNKVEEFLFFGEWNWKYFTKTDIKHALLFHESKKAFDEIDEYFKIEFSLEQKRKIKNYFISVYETNFEHLTNQKVLKKFADRKTISDKTVEDFLKSLSHGTNRTK